VDVSACIAKALEVPEGKVFLVEDDPGVRRALHRLILSAGFDVQAFADAASYLAAPAADRPACLVLDIRMPGVDGFVLQGLVAGTRRSLPIIFITGHGDEDIRAQAMAAGAVDVLFKPIDEAALLAAIEKALSAAGAG
jgi:FixJ family two-component response regulator